MPLKHYGNRRKTSNLYLYSFLWKHTDGDNLRHRPFYFGLSVLLLRACGIDYTVAYVNEVIGNTLKPRDERGIVGAYINIAVALGKSGKVACDKLVLFLVNACINERILQYAIYFIKKWYKAVLTFLKFSV